MEKKINRALISVFHKEGLEPIVRHLHALNIEIISTDGTYHFINSLDIPCRTVEKITKYPPMLHGRVKTLHPMVFGGILAQRDNTFDQKEVKKYDLDLIDLVIVDLYPFSEVLERGATDQEIIEKIDIGGISLIRAAAKNFKDVVIIPSRNQYSELLSILEDKKGITSLKERIYFAKTAFAISSDYDSKIFSYFDRDNLSKLRLSIDDVHTLRYGENPHQNGYFFGNLDKIFDKIQGKELSYNNLQDIDAAIHIISEFSNRPTFAILKHTNPCGLASGKTVFEAFDKALKSDPESAFGGILISNRIIDEITAEAIDHLFFEILIAPGFNMESISILEKKRNRILLVTKEIKREKLFCRSILGGILVQEYDNERDCIEDCHLVTYKEPTKEEIEDCLFAQRIVKHCKSNAIVLVKNLQLIGVGIGQTSRVVALKQAIEKAMNFGFTLNGAVLGSDAFLPFSDCVEIAGKNGIKTIIQPGGSIRDKDSITKANEQGIAMLFTSKRHFKH